jgi:hypothetical protein
MYNATARFLNRKIKWTSFSRFWCVLLIMDFWVSQQLHLSARSSGASRSLWNWGEMAMRICQDLGKFSWKIFILVSGEKMENILLHVVLSKAPHPMCHASTCLTNLSHVFLFITLWFLSCKLLGESNAFMILSLQENNCAKEKGHYAADLVLT